MLVIEAGYPPPQTQIPVYGPYGELVGIVDMGWEDIKIALEYEGDHHRTNRRVFNNDIARHETMTTDLGWIAIRVTAADVPGGILRRLAAAWARRGATDHLPQRCGRGELHRHPLETAHEVGRTQRKRVIGHKLHVR